MTHSDRRRLVFVFVTGSRFIGTNRKATDSDRYRRWKRENFPGEGEVKLEIRIANEDDLAKANDPDTGVGKAVRESAGRFDPFPLTPPIGAYPCYYAVYAVEKRRKCQCPDGSPCRKQRR